MKISRPAVTFIQRPIFLFLYLFGLLITPALLANDHVWAADEIPYTRTEDVIYGRKDGMALTMDVFAPQKNVNGAAVVWAVSGGWYSSHDSIPGTFGFINVFVQRGYTVFAVVHGSQPKYTIPEILPDMQRAVRYIRFHAADYQINPSRIGISGASSGGHLSLMQGVTGNDGTPDSPDPVERVSSRVQAVACFFPPTDFLNYGKPGEYAIGSGVLKDFAAPFAFNNDDPEKKKQMAWLISPINHVSADDPPILIDHGDSDTLVPLQQSEIMIAKLKEIGVPNRLIVKQGGGHGWGDILNDMTAFADWFDTYLLKK